MEFQREGLVSTCCTWDKLGGGGKKGMNKILKNVSVTEPESFLCWLQGQMGKAVWSSSFSNRSSQCNSQARAL